MSIDIDKKDGNYGCVGVIVKGIYECKRNAYKYRVTKETYYGSDLFELIVHKEITPTRTTYLTFKSGSFNINFKSFRFIDTNNLDKVEVFFPINGGKPLVLGVITKNQRYYSLSVLIQLPSFTNIFGVNSFGENQLLDNLIKENNKQNNVITYRLDKKTGDDSYDGVDFEKIKHPSFHKYKHTPKHGFGDRTSYVLYKGKQLQLSEGQSYRGSGSQLKTIQEKCYCEIIVWHFKPSNTDETNPPNYLELKEKNVQDSNNHTYYLERYYHAGVFWTQIENPKLENVITYLLDKKPLNSEKYNDNSIEVKKSSNDSFEFYTHTPDPVHGNKKGYLRFTDKDLELVQNDHLGAETTRLDKFNANTYCSVSLFYYKGGNTGFPEFLELKVKGNGDSASETQGCTGTSKCYLFQIADTEGVKWTQIDYQDLKNTTIFRLECKDEHSDGYEKTVVSYGSEESFYVYTHTPIDSTKFGLFLYKWKVIILQSNDGLPSDTIKLGKIQGKIYCKVCVYYSKSHSSEHPIYLKLVGITTSDCSSRSDTPNSNDYWLQRIDPNGHHWKQIKKPDLSSIYPQHLIEEIKNYKNSIMVRLTEKYEYRMSIIKNYRTDAVGEITIPTKNILNNRDTLKNSNYRYYEHEFSESKKLENYNIDSLRIFIGNIEIKIYGNSSDMVKLYYDPETDRSKKIQVFFYQLDSVPLMLIWDNSPYAANKTDYFTKWKQISELITPDPSDEDSSIQIKSELDKINKQFNEILLKNTDQPEYGISAPPSGKTPSGFSLNRVTVSKSSATSTVIKFGKVTHTVSNKSSIGRVMLDKKELKDENGRSLLEALLDGPEFKSAAVVSVIAYYHRTDSGYTKPLLLGFVKTGGRNIPDVFYERQCLNDDSRWAKIQRIIELRREDGIAKRVDIIRYNIGKSFKIRMDKQTGEDGSASYKAELVPNTKGGGDPESVDSGQNIKVSKGDCSMASSEGYTCFTHLIPDLSSTASDGSTNNPYVSGLKLCICEKTYINTELPIYYDPNYGEVKVYFYVTSTEKSDNVSLLVEYNGNHYKPSSRDEYFTRWEKVEVTPREVGGDVGAKTLHQVLDEINKKLNTIELDKTGSTGVYKYGIKQPDSEAGNCGSGTNIHEFCNRVSVKQADNNHYKKLIHSTTNKGPIGSVVLSGKTIDAINSAKLAAKSNKVEVYYHTSDSSYIKPLLICLGSQETEKSCLQWYYRNDVEGKEWKRYTPNKYNPEDNIRDKLNQINASMSNFLYLEIDKQDKYLILAKSGSGTQGNEQSVTQGKQHKAEIKIDMSNACSFYNPGKNYRCFKHKMVEYYTLNEADIKRALQTQERPTLEVKITIVGHKLKLDKSDGSSLPIQLTYGPTEQRTNSNAYVYFFEPNGQTDKVPLLFMFGDQFFGPASKNMFFEKWKEYTIDTRTGTTVNIKTTLNQITRLLNFIDLKQTSDTIYGDIQPTGGLSRNPLDAEKRVSVTKCNDTEFISITHSTEKTGCVGAVKYQNDELTIIDDSSTSAGKPWSEAIEAELKSGTKAIDIYNDLTAYYHKSDIECKNPLLIKISGSISGSHSRVENLYYERAEKDNNFKWKKVGVEDSRKFTDGGSLTYKINSIFGSDKSVAIQFDRPPSNNHHELNVVQDRGQETSSSDAQTGRTASSPTTDNRGTSTRNGGHPQQPGVGGGFSTSSGSEASNSRPSEGGENGTPRTSSDGKAGASGEAGPPGPSVENGDPHGGGSSNSGTLHQIMEVIKKPEVYASASGVAGVGVMATVGGVVYKKCIVGGAVAAGKAAAKVAASAASGM